MLTGVDLNSLMKKIRFFKTENLSLRFSATLTCSSQQCLPIIDLLFSLILPFPSILYLFCLFVLFVCLQAYSLASTAETYLNLGLYSFVVLMSNGQTSLEGSLLPLLNSSCFTRTQDEVSLEYNFDLPHGVSFLS